MRSQIKLMTFLAALILMFFTLSFPAYSAIEAHSFDTDLQRERYQSFIEEMRCPKCQNQNLAGSDSPISADLRRELYEMIKEGKADKEIIDFMVARYGDFILYRPRVTPVTYVLWAAPVVLLTAGIIVLLIMLRQRRRLALMQSSSALTDEEQARLNALLADNEVEEKTCSANTSSAKTKPVKSNVKNNNLKDN